MLDCTPDMHADEMLSWPARQWRQAIKCLSAAMAQRNAHPSEVVVLLPYLQLIGEAQQAWAAYAPQAVFMPRFETTVHWAAGFGGAIGVFTPSEIDLRMDAAVDTLTAASLLVQAGLSAQHESLAGHLVEAAWSLARVAAAVIPEERMAWGTRVADTLDAGLDSPALAVETAIGRIALVWAAASSYPTDRLFQARPALLVVIDGFQNEPVTEALKKYFGDRVVSIRLCPATEPPALSSAARLPSLHAATDAEDEACRAAACVLAHLEAGRRPVALVAQDRQLTRRVTAMLAGRGIAMRDETGWKLSTSRAAAGVIGLLRALAWDVSADAVLDWLKNAPFCPAAAVQAAETEMRKFGLKRWRELPTAPRAALAATQALAGPVNDLRASLRRPRPLADWLRDFRQGLQQAGQWEALLQDDVGQRVIEALRLHDGAEAEFAAVPAMRREGFTNWVNQTLEAQTFTAAHALADQVVILPIGQLLGRRLQAVVLPGCDEIRLPVSPEPSGPWTPAQRELLGLPSREDESSTARQTWDYALRLPQVDLLWRTSEGGDGLMPSGFVLELLLDQSGLDAPAVDPRHWRSLLAQPVLRPQAIGTDLPVSRLSASSYSDLRSCPYRFFALRQLGLVASDELETELGKRDFGNWLHQLLCAFHAALQADFSTDMAVRTALIDSAANQARRQLGLGDSEFLPFAAAWPQVRDGYLAWLTGHEAAGARFEQAESRYEIRLGNWTLVGQIDRIDRLANGQRMVIDYKTEPRTVTVERIKNGVEDSQLAFYATLATDDTLAAAYVNVGEKEGVRTYAQDDIVDLRDGLVASLMADMDRIGKGSALQALGEGKACSYCAARGLCRRDFWSA